DGPAMPDLPEPDDLPLVQNRFPGLPSEQLRQLGRLVALLRDWNERVNLVSRKDVGHLEEHHLLHSLAIFQVLRPEAGVRFADLGTGGGFPGLPLAVVYPECRFTLVDSIAKKARAVEEIAAAVGLGNVQVVTARAEKISGRFDYVLRRTVATLPQFLRWASPLLRTGSAGESSNGVFYLKGTLYREEIAGLRCAPPTAWELEKMLPGLEYFREKFLLHFPAPLYL
ncbi:MAG TPA: 16S rRNA (guanine(527)-N(7))-methyltransferase RsmG, partial [Opitutaceae bacterium]